MAAGEFLETAYANGNRSITLFIDPVLNAAPSPQFEALLAKTADAINAERAKLGLPAIEMPEPYL